MSWLADHFTPLWIVWGLELGLIVVVFGVVLRRRGESIRDAVGLSGFTLLMLLIYASSVLLAPLATAFSSPTAVDWWQMAAVRVAWQLGGGVLMGTALVWEARDAGKLRDRRIWLAVGGLILVGGLLCTRSLRDLIEGPLVLRGKPAFEVDKTPSGRGGGAIRAKLALHAADGTTREVDLSGWRATHAAGQLAACYQSDEITVTILRYVDAVLAVTCAPPR